MVGENSRKRSFVEISSSEESQPESSSPESGEESVGTIDSSPSSDGDDEGARELIDSEADEDEPCVDKDDAESMCNRVIHMIQGRTNLQELKIVECKAYLRMHRLRLSGTKEECIERIKEHWRLKNVSGETLYPRSSFVINCTGDVCKGDVVVFNQKVYPIVNKRTNGNSRGLKRRTVAGRIVKDSYGAAKQQHTFTVEVLWSKGGKILDPLTPLLVKGRNLYKMKTYRQLWKDEKERLGVLDEKHKRGAAARTIRAMRNTKAVAKTHKPPSAYKALKHRKHFHDEKNSINGRGNKGSTKHKELYPILSPNPSQTSCWNKNSHRRHQSPMHSNRVTEPYFSTQRFDHFEREIFPREPHHFPSHRRHQNPMHSNRVTEPNFSTQRFDHFEREIFPREPHHSPSHWRHQNPMHTNRVTEPPCFPHDFSTQRFDHFQRDIFQREPHHFPSHRGPFHNSVMNSIPRWDEFSRGSFADPGYLLCSSSADIYRWR